MAIATTGSQVNVLGTNVAGQVVPFPYRFFTNSDLTVQTLNLLNGAVATLAINTDYTVTGADNIAGGSVTVIAAVPTTSEIVVVRNLPETQTVSFITGDRLPASTLERALDKLTMLLQEATRQVTKALRFSDVTVAQPPLTPLANSVLSTNASNELSFVPTSAATGDTPYFLRASTAGATPSFAPMPLITAPRIASDAVITSKILDANVTPPKIGGNPALGQYVLGSTNGTVLWQLPSTTGIADDAVTTTKIADDAVTSPKLQSSASVDADRAVTTAHIRDNAVVASKLRSDPTVDNVRAVTTDHIRDNAVDGNKLLSSSSDDTLRAVTTAHIRENAVVASRLRSDASVDANRAVTTNHIRDNAITSAKILDSNIDHTKLTSGMVVGRAYGQQVAVSTISGNVTQLPNPANAIAPLVTIGVQMLALSYTPKAVGNIMVARFTVLGTTAAAAQNVVAMIFEGSVCRGMTYISQRASAWRELSVNTNIVVANNINPRVFTARVALHGAAAGTTPLISLNTGFWDGTVQAILEITEYKA